MRVCTVCRAFQPGTGALLRPLLLAAATVAAGVPSATRGSALGEGRRCFPADLGAFSVAARAAATPVVPASAAAAAAAAAAAMSGLSGAEDLSDELAQVSQTMGFGGSDEEGEY